MQSVARLVAAQPGRYGDAPPDEELLAELTAVAFFMEADQAELVESIRCGGGEHDTPSTSRTGGER